ncbi:MAG TPA: cyclic nucleotide-binding domain-containing protein [bacterium]|nr:cyclic nucleotide-binding domain-containing protein [bacterium]
MRELSEVLADHMFFRGLPPGDVEFIAGCGSNVHYAENAIMFREGGPADHFYLLRHGRVALEIASPDRGPLTVLTLGAGEVVGWSWLVPPYRMSCDARALEPVRATQFDGACIRRKCEENPRLGYELLKRFAGVLGQRLRATRLQVLDVYGTRV